MNNTPNLSEQSVAEAYLLLLKAYGIDYLYMNAGTDFAPLIEAYARLEADSQNSNQYPKPIIGTHENLVIGMAHGAYLVSGKPQAAMFHVNVGTANAACGVINAAAERIPIFIAAGRTPYLESGKVGARDTRTNWGQEMFDQNALVREAVKWDYELHDQAHVREVINRAFSLANTEPKGPVYLSLPREVLAEAMQTPQLPDNVWMPVSSTISYPDPSAVKQLADKLINAEMPVISALASGADQSTVELLTQLCERFAIGYVEELARYMNFPAEHPMHLGYQINPIFAEADVICFLESDVPWLQKTIDLKPETFIAQCGVDPHFSKYPMRSHRSDLSITSAINPLLKALITELEQLKARIDTQRFKKINEKSILIKETYQQAIEQSKNAQAPIDYLFISHSIGEILHQDCLLFNEYYAQPSALAINTPGSYFFLPASGGLGWSLPAAIGAKIQNPDKTCIVAIGDGSYLFNNPAACHQASHKHDAPVLTIICNNAYWNAVDWTSKTVYPEGTMNNGSRLPIANIGPSPEFEKYVQASNGYGETVSERSELLPALNRALAVVEKEGRQAAINVICP